MTTCRYLTDGIIYSKYLSRCPFPRRPFYRLLTLCNPTAVTIVSTTPIFTQIYNESVGIAGTNFVAMGLGFFLWSQIQARLLDVVYRRLKLRYGGEGKPEYRLPMMIPASVFLPFGLLLYGWGAQMRLHWIAPDIGLAFIAAGMIGNFQVSLARTWIYLHFRVADCHCCLGGVLQ